LGNNAPDVSGQGQLANDTNATSKRVQVATRKNQKPINSPTAMSTAGLLQVAEPGVKNTREGKELPHAMKRR